jgi:hypothetical protein
MVSTFIICVDMLNWEIQPAERSVNERLRDGKL